MKYVTQCPVCQCELLIPFGQNRWRPRSLHLAQARCDGCGILISQPQVEPKELEAYYSSEYYQEPTEEETSEKFNYFRGFYERHEWPLMQSLWSHRPPPKGGTAVEVGCGLGIILDILKENGFKTHGCDLSSSAVAWCRSRGHDVVVSGFPHSALPAGSFDVVCAMQFIEHTIDLSGFINELVGLAKPGGIIVVSSESIWMAQARFERFSNWIRGRSQSFRTSSDHTLLFEPIHVRRLLEKAGCDEAVSAKYSHRIDVPESLHWKIYKGSMRLIDRLTSSGECHLTVGWKRR